LHEKRLRKRIDSIAQNGQPLRRRQHFTDEFNVFSGQFGRHPGHAGNVAARSNEAGNHAGRNRIARAGHDDRNLACRLFGRAHRRS